MDTRVFPSRKRSHFLGNFVAKPSRFPQPDEWQKVACHSRDTRTGSPPGQGSAWPPQGLAGGRGRYLLAILASTSLTQGAAGFTQTISPCFVVALRGEGGGEPGAGLRSRVRGRGRGASTYMTSGTAQCGPSAMSSTRASRRGGISSETVRTQRQRSSPASGAPAAGGAA